jgi:hypothetical protein
MAEQLERGKKNKPLRRLIFYIEKLRVKCTEILRDIKPCARWSLVWIAGAILSTGGILLWTDAPCEGLFLGEGRGGGAIGRTPSGWVISRSQRSLYLTTHTTLTTDRHICTPRWDSNPQSQQASGRRPTALDRAVNWERLKGFNSSINLVSKYDLPQTEMYRVAREVTLHPDNTHLRLNLSLHSTARSTM